MSNEQTIVLELFSLVMLVAAGIWQLGRIVDALNDIAKRLREKR